MPEARIPPPHAETELHGRLSAESVEGGGLFVIASDGRRAQLVLPRGWRKAGAPAAILDPAGVEVATLTDEVVVVGSFSEAVSSTRQQGRMFLVTALSRVGPA